MRKLWLMGCSILLLVSLAAAKGSSDEDAIRKLDADWSAAAQSKDVEKTIAAYAEDAVFLPSGAPIATGKAQIRDAWSHLLALPGVDLKFSPTKIEVAKSRDMAYDVGVYQLKVNDPQGNPTIQIGKYVVVWKKQGDKSWKAVADIFNPDK
ncbi:MAG: YybH family protein [Terriglobales bacterium]